MSKHSEAEQKLAKIIKNIGNTKKTQENTRIYKDKSEPDQFPYCFSEEPFKNQGGDMRQLKNNKKIICDLSFFMVFLPKP